MALADKAVEFEPLTVIVADGAAEVAARVRRRVAADPRKPEHEQPLALPQA